MPEVMGVVMESQVATKGGGVGRGNSGVCGSTAHMGRRRFLCGGVAAALAMPLLGVAATAQATGAGQSVVVVALTGASPETGVGGWIDTTDGGRYDVTNGVVAIPGKVGQTLGATVYRDDGCTRQITLVFQVGTTFIQVGGC